LYNFVTFKSSIAMLV